MRKKVLCVLSLIFMGLMLFGTFFHQKIDGLFREKVELAEKEIFCEEYQEIVEVDGIETAVIKKETFLLLPGQAVREGKVYVVETIEVPYGSYEVVRLKEVETAGMVDSMVKISAGLSETDRVAAVFSDFLCDGMRVKVELSGQP